LGGEGPFVHQWFWEARRVDLPYDIRDLFIQVGLARKLPSLWLQTSLILGFGAGASFLRQRKLAFWRQIAHFPWFDWFTASSAASRRYGVWEVIALAMRRKVKLLRSLLIAAAAFLLLFKSLWIWDLGFQLSFLATLGLRCHH